MSPRLRNFVVLFAGLLFAGGLGLSGMTQPSKVIGFLDVTQVDGPWDPSLAFVMGGAVGVYAIAVTFARKRKAPLLAPAFAWPTAKAIDARLVIGAALFGVGWGMSGFCPGPAIVSAASFVRETLVFVVVMAATVGLTRRVLSLRAKKGSELAPEHCE